MSTQAERLAALERGLSDHEGRCEERLDTIKELVGKTDEAVEKLQSFVVGLIVAVGGFALVTLVAVVLRASKLLE